MSYLWLGLHPELVRITWAPSPWFLQYPWDSRNFIEKKKLSWDDTMYPWFTSLPCWKQHQNLPTQRRPHNQIQLSCGKCFRPVSSSGDRDRNTSWWGWPWPGAMLQMDLSDYFAKKHKYQSLRMMFLTYVGLIQGLPGLSKMVKLFYHPNLVCLKSWHLHIHLPPTLSRSFPVRFPSTEVSNVLLGAWQRVQSPLLWQLVGDGIIPHSWVVRGWTVEILKHIAEKTI